MRRHVAVPTSVLLAMLGSGGGSLPAQTPLPAGVKRVVLGEAIRAKDPARGDTCTIPNALATPARFKTGVKEISYVVEVEPNEVREVSASIVGNVGSRQLTGMNCNAYTICSGALCQTQFGSSLSRSDGEPLKAGSYTLEIVVVSAASVRSPALKLSFEIK